MEGSLGAAAMGRFAKDSYVQVTIYTAALAEDESRFYSFTFLVERSVIESKQLSKGSFVECKLQGIVISPQHPVWVCLGMDGIYDWAI